MVDFIYRLECEGSGVSQHLVSLKKQWPTTKMFEDQDRLLTLDFSSAKGRDDCENALKRHYDFTHITARNITREICLNCKYCERAECRRYPEPKAISLEHWCGEFEAPGPLPVR